VNFSDVLSDPEGHELFGEFWVVWVFEKMDPPPPVPSAVLKHVFGVNLPYVTEVFVHASSRIR